MKNKRFFRAHVVLLKIISFLDLDTLTEKKTAGVAHDGNVINDERLVSVTAVSKGDNIFFGHSKLFKTFIFTILRALCCLAAYLENALAVSIFQLRLAL